MEKKPKTVNSGLEKIKDLTESLLTKLGIAEYELEIDNDLENELVRVSINLNDPGMMIGFKGRTLNSFQQILSLMINNNSKKEYQRILVDINSYRKEQDDRLREVAAKAAEKAVETSQEVRLLPMSSYERRLIHMTLSDDPQIETFSEGEGSSRRIVIKPKQ